MELVRDRTGVVSPQSTKPRAVHLGPTAAQIRRGAQLGQRGGSHRSLVAGLQLLSEGGEVPRVVLVRLSVRLVAEQQYIGNTFDAAARPAMPPYSSRAAVAGVTASPPSPPKPALTASFRRSLGGDTS